jgi:hypothetical protein
MKRKLFLIVGSVCIIAAGRTKPAAAQSDLKPVPKPTPYLLCNTSCTNSSVCASDNQGCIICIHPENKCG